MEVLNSIAELPEVLYPEPESRAKRRMKAAHDRKELKRQHKREQRAWDVSDLKKPS